MISITRKLKRRDSDIPDELICPITRELMKDPVKLNDDHTYERSAIEHWLFSGRHTSPLTNLPVSNPILIPDFLAKRKIRSYKEENSFDLFCPITKELM